MCWCTCVRMCACLCVCLRACVRVYVWQPLVISFSWRSKFVGVRAYVCVLVCRPMYECVWLLRLFVALTSDVVWITSNGYYIQRIWWKPSHSCTVAHSFSNSFSASLSLSISIHRQMETLGETYIHTLRRRVRRVQKIPPSRRRRPKKSLVGHVESPLGVLFNRKSIE